MPISTTCPSCSAIFRLPDELAGRKVKCQKCDQLFVVPQTDASTLSPGSMVPTVEAPQADEQREAAPVQAESVRAESVQTHVQPPPPLMPVLGATVEPVDAEPPPLPRRDST